MDDLKWSKNQRNTQVLYNNNNQTSSITNGQHHSTTSLSSANHKNSRTGSQHFIEPPPPVSSEHIENSHLPSNCDIQRIHLNDGLDKQVQIQQIVETSISEEARVRIHQILELVSALSSAEKLLLYLRLPTDTKSVSDPLRQPLNPLGSRTEISQTINWIRTHLEEDPHLAMQKQDVYEEYIAYCLENDMKALSTADFGKVMKQVYPRVRPRRLGTRGNSKYCYAGLRKRIKLEPPILPDLLDFPKSTEMGCSQNDLVEAASRLIREWAENLLGVPFSSLDALACHLIDIGSVDSRSVAALTVNNVFGRSSDKTNKAKETAACKHRETQIQLQRKLHQREVIREQKRKLQLQIPKCDSNVNATMKRAKKVKTELCTPSTSPTFDEPDLVLQGSSQTQGTSDTFQLASDCDNKITSSTSQPATLPDFSSFQSTLTTPNDIIDFSTRVKSKNVSDVISVKSFANKSLSRSNSFEKEKDKLGIPKLPKTKPFSQNPKYKVIREDVVIDRVASSDSDLRSHDNNEAAEVAASYPALGYYNQIDDDNKEKLKLPLIPRERVVSIGNIDKDALDDYLYSGNNSQEQEEEIMQYFQNDDLDKLKVKMDPIEKNDKISQLRLLLEKNLKTTELEQAKPTSKSLILSSLLSSGSGLNTKRRVSFDTVTTDSVPPSPNTRRKNFSFTPISPGPNSPGTKSKNSSTNASPFVSPRSTPIPLSNKYGRNRTQNSTNRAKQQRKPEEKLSIDISKTTGDFVIPNDRKHLPMSAPPSPMLMSQRQKISNQTYLQTLLDNDLWTGQTYVQNDKNIDEYINKKLQGDSKNVSKLKLNFNGGEKKFESYPVKTTDYKVHSADALSHEVSQFFPDEPFNNNVFRSQSVPLHQMKQDLLSPNSVTSYYPPVNYNYVSNVTSTCSSVGQTPVPNEYSDFTTSLNELNNENLDKIFHILQNDSNQQLLTNQTDLNMIQNLTEILPNDQLLPENGLIRSQSIDFTNTQKPNFQPSRSVPSTPLPYQKELSFQEYETKSYPSTPLINETDFSYKNISDYLLNGQPVRSKPEDYHVGFIKKDIINEPGFENFGFANNVLLDGNERGTLMEFSQFSRDNTTDGADLMHLEENGPETSDNFVTSTNNEQQIFLKAANGADKFVAGSTKLT